MEGIWGEWKFFKRWNLAQWAFLALGLALGIVSTGCTSGKKELWIYTSLYKEVIAEMEPMLAQAFPGETISFFQGGSENVASKVNAELKGGHTKADLILTSDPFWYQELKESGKLDCYESPSAKEVPANLRDPEHCFVTARIPVVVIGYNSEALTPNELPQSWKDLTLPKWRGKLSMGSPMESGTHFTAAALLSKTFGWDYFQTLRGHDLISSGGNSTVVTRIETRERPVGVVLLENILKAQAKGSPIRPIYPMDGAIPVPSPIAILKDSDQKELARRVYDWFFTPEAQNAIVRSGMYSPLSKIVSPDNARPWKELERQLMPWTPETLKELYRKRQEVKSKFQDVVLK